MHKKSIGIIGWWFGWLATAILLAKDGHKVHVYEKNTTLGGRANIFEVDGFRFDMGPSWYLMPDVFEKFFADIGEDVHQWLDLKKLGPSYRIRFDAHHEKNSVVDIYAEPEKVAETLEQLEPGVKQKFFDYLAKSAYQYKIGMKFVYKNYDRIRDFFTRETMIEWSKLRVFTNLFNYVKRFFKSDKVQKIIQYTLVFLGTSPYQAPALYNIMSHVDFAMGVFYPQGGIYEITKALVAIGKKYGVVYHTDVSATSIVVHNGVATSFVDQHHTEHTHDIIVCNADMAWAETHLLDTQWQTYPARYRQTKTFAPSAFILYLWINKKIPELTHHNLIFSQDWQQNFAEIFDYKTLPWDPSLYICKPSHTDPSVAPAGKENLFVLVPIANDMHISDDTAAVYSHKIIDLIEKTCAIQLRDDIIVQRVFHGKDFAQMYNAWHGTALGLAHTLRQTAIFRPNNISKKVQNLFYVWHNTNPWIGMPMVLISAQLVHERIKHYLTQK